MDSERERSVEGGCIGYGHSEGNLPGLGVLRISSHLIYTRQIKVQDVQLNLNSDKHQYAWDKLVSKKLFVLYFLQQPTEVTQPGG